MTKKYIKLQRTMLLEYPRVVCKVERETDTAIMGTEWGLTMEQIIALVMEGVPLRKIAMCYPWTDGEIPKDIALSMIDDDSVSHTMATAMASPATLKVISVLCAWMDDGGKLQMGLAYVAKSVRWLTWGQGSTYGDDEFTSGLVLDALRQLPPKGFKWCILDADGWPVATEREAGQ